MGCRYKIGGGGIHEEELTALGKFLSGEIWEKSSCGILVNRGLRGLNSYGPWEKSQGHQMAIWKKVGLTIWGETQQKKKSGRERA